jgi:hypothetical protein
MQTLESIKAIIAQCKFNDWYLHIGQYENDGPLYLQVLFKDKDRITGKEEIQRCRKYVLSYHMTDSEVVRSAFQAVKAAMMHEVEEAFTYKGRRVFNPHMDLDNLAGAIADGTIGLSLREENNYVPSVTSIPSQA